MKSNSGKWVNIGMSKEDREKQYSKLRIKANTILKKRYKNEYSKILKMLLKKEFRKLKN